MNLLDLFVKIGVEDKASDTVDKTSKTIQSKLSTAAKVGTAAMAALAAGTVALTKGLTDAVTASAQYGDTVDKTSQKLGVSAEAYQKWDYVMNVSGTSMQNMSMGLKTLTNQLDNAANGSTDAQEKFAKLGISMEDIGSMSREELFEKAIRGFQGMADSTERAALANDLFGRSGQELTPLFNMSIEQTEELMAATEEYGMIMSDDAVKASAAFVDAQTTLDKTMSGVRNKLTAEFMPALTDVMTGFTEMFGGKLEQGLERVQTAIQSAIDKVAASAPSVLAAGLKLAVAIANGIAKGVPNMLRQVAALVRNLVNEIKGGSRSMLKGAGELFMEIGKAVIQVLPDISASLFELVMTLVGELVENAPEMLAGGIELFATLATAVSEAAGRVLTALGTMLGNLVAAVAAKAGEMLAAAGTLLQGLIDGIMGKDTEATEAARKIVDGIIQGIVSLFGKFIEVGGKIVTNIASGIGNFFGNLFGLGIDMSNEVARGVDNGGSAVKSAGGALTGDLADGMNGNSGAAWGAGQSVAGSARDGAGSVSLYGVGASAVDGLARGILDNIWRGANAAVQLGLSVANSANSVLEVNSPSKVFMRLGESVDEGFAMGIERGGSDVVDAMNGVADSVFDAANGGVDFGAAYGAAYETAAAMTPVNVSVGQMVVREEADVNRIAEQLYDLTTMRTGARLWSL